MPRAWAAMPMRPMSRVCCGDHPSQWLAGWAQGLHPRAPTPTAGLTMAILKPIPGSPSRLSLGMRQSSKMRLAVDEARMPSLSSFFPSVSPGVGMGTRKALMP